MNNNRAKFIYKECRYSKIYKKITNKHIQVLTVRNVGYNYSINPDPQAFEKYSESNISESEFMEIVSNYINPYPKLRISKEIIPALIVYFTNKNEGIVLRKGNKRTLISKVNKFDCMEFKDYDGEKSKSKMIKFFYEINKNTHKVARVDFMNKF